MEPAELLKKYFGYDAFRPVQQDVIDTILSGKDVLAIMPTGAGKSVCFQIPALEFPHGTIIISPLISLMKDQVETLVEQGIPASYVNSTVSFEESIERLRDLYRGRLKILYMAPEKLEPTYFTQCLVQVPLSMVVIDEAHCVSQWGHDFRPSYQKIRTFIDSLPQKPIVTAFTATATSLVEEDMKRSLGLAEAAVFKTGLDRPNLSFRVIRGTDKEDFILKYVKNHRRESGIIYCATRKAVDEVYELLKKHGIKAGRYHAGMEDGERRQGQEDFSFDRVGVMVATNAFGMGIDKSNVRYVLHYQMPKSMEAYYQEAGRAGRDGAKAECILLYSGRDAGIQRYLIESGSQTEEQRQMDYDRLNRMNDYCQTTSCLRNYILSYFGEESAEVCGHCGNCEGAEARSDITDAATLIFKTIRSLGGRFGVSVVADILKGSRSKTVLENHLDETPTYRKLSFEKTKHIKEAINSFVADGYLKRDGGQYPVVRLTEKAEAVLGGKENVMGLAFGAEDIMAEAAVERTYAVSRERGTLFDTLRDLRTRIAREEHVPPFVVFSDATLEDMVLRMPGNENEMAEVHGIGAFKLKKYGARFLAVLKEAGKGEREEKKSGPDRELEEKTVFTRLATLRLRLSKQEKKAPFQIFSDTILHEMAKSRPKTVDDLLQIKGIGPKKADAYGKAFLAEMGQSRKKLAAYKEKSASGIEEKAFLLYLEKVRQRLAGKEKRPAEDICSEAVLRQTVHGQPLPMELDMACRKELEKAIRTYREITKKAD